MVVSPYIRHSPYVRNSPPCPGEIEDRIQQLCARIVATEDEGELNQLCADLQGALKEHIQFLRDQVANYRAVSKPHPPKKGE